MPRLKRIGHKLPLRPTNLGSFTSRICMAGRGPSPTPPAKQICRLYLRQAPASKNRIVAGHIPMKQEERTKASYRRDTPTGNLRPTTLRSTESLRSNGTLSERTGHSARATIACVSLLWLTAVLVGALLHTDVSQQELRDLKHQLPLLWFDKILRQYGTLLPFPALIIRWWGSALSSKRDRVRRPSHFAEVFCVYTGLSAARLAVYILHVSGLLHYVVRVFFISHNSDDQKGHLMSDHLFLGAALTAMSATESALAMGDLQQVLQYKRKDAFRLVCITSALAQSLCLCLATILDMYYTARYFHDHWETFGAVILGWLFFQAPLSYWLLGGFWYLLPASSMTTES